MRSTHTADRSPKTIGDTEFLILVSRICHLTPQGYKKLLETRIKHTRHTRKHAKTSLHANKTPNTKLAQALIGAKQNAATQKKANTPTPPQIDLRPRHTPRSGITSLVSKLRDAIPAEEDKTDLLGKKRKKKELTTSPLLCSVIPLQWQGVAATPAAAVCQFSF